MSAKLPEAIIVRAIHEAFVKYPARRQWSPVVLPI
jgi:hypothetical protein